MARATSVPKMPSGEYTASSIAKPQRSIIGF
jgi:hypothetical protein